MNDQRRSGEDWKNYSLMSIDNIQGEKNTKAACATFYIFVIILL